ncbi:hypothetical protein VHA01S_018_00680 [Vibrio halioticoli NBRC 102217]|uniref:Uncharacterized protein n=1 Tax=Vibrio halioticoli NBRC 102217 TaxID=1219072 RepID=V5HIY3_9VIBR|nr:hypothetical protein [Vibrio halioticoli]GAD89280.1 hypothetical protein VHA01S_018_00680 [Vibrio halioticoli NBRC 102217]
MKFLTFIFIFIIAGLMGTAFRASNRALNRAENNFKRKHDLGKYRHNKGKPDNEKTMSDKEFKEFMEQQLNPTKVTPEYQEYLQTKELVRNMNDAEFNAFVTNLISQCQSKQELKETALLIKDLRGTA